MVGSFAVGSALVLVLGLSRDNLDSRLLSRLNVLGQLDLAHAAGANCLAQGPCSRAGRGDGGPPLGVWLDVAGAGVGGYTVDGHRRGRRRVRRIPCVASSAGIGALGVFAASRGLFLGEVALLVVAASNVVEGGGLVAIVGVPGGA